MLLLLKLSKRKRQRTKSLTNTGKVSNISNEAKPTANYGCFRTY
jgi:hypothetical protein